MRVLVACGSLQRVVGERMTPDNRKSELRQFTLRILFVACAIIAAFLAGLVLSRSHVRDLENELIELNKELATTRKQVMDALESVDLVTQRAGQMLRSNGIDAKKLRAKAETGRIP